MRTNEVFGRLADLECSIQETLNSLGEGIDYRAVLITTRRDLSEILNLFPQLWPCKDIMYAEDIDCRPCGENPPCGEWADVPF